MKNPFGPVYQWKVRLAFGVIATLIILGIVVFINWLRDNKTVVVAATESDVQKVVDDARVLMTNMSVEKAVPVIDEEPNAKVLTYLIESRRVGEFWFQEKHFRFNRRGDINLDKLLEALDRAYER